VRVEAEIDLPALEARLEQEYGIVAERLTYHPSGEVSYSYEVEAANAGPSGLRRYFVKIISDTRAGRFSAERLPFYLPLTAYLFNNGLFSPISPPLPTCTGGLWSQFAGRPLIVHPFVEGRNPEAEWDQPEIQAQMGGLVGRLHALTPQLGLAVPYYEAFTLPFEADLLRGLAALDQITRHDSPGKQALKALLLPKRPTALHLLDRLHSLGQEARATWSPQVLCHTDIHSANVIQRPDGALIILDWEGAMLAPPEYDLFIFNGPAFSDFLQSYRQALGPVQLHPARFAYYFFRRNLEDMTDFLIRILFENNDPAQDEYDLEGMRQLCFDGWEWLERGVFFEHPAEIFCAPNAHSG
jgi:spectinomycin phosphotransferase